MRIQKEDCAFVVIDIQERLFQHIQDKDFMAQKCTTLIQGM